MLILGIIAGAVFPLIFPCMYHAENQVKVAQAGNDHGANY